MSRSILFSLFLVPCVSAQAPRSYFNPAPRVLNVATLGPNYHSAAISGVRVADFDRDGFNDVAVAWFATDPLNFANNRRRLTIFYGDGAGGFERATELDLYIHNVLDPLSIFRFGTAALGTGDYDGDGDVDLAVGPFFGDELWIIENTGHRTYVPRLRYPFGFNSTGNSITPPEMAAADLDGDGREELIYIADPLQRIQGFVVHIWRTDGTVAGMERVDWDAGAAIGVINYTWSLAVADFDGDGAPDIAFGGTTDPGQELAPTLVLWHQRNAVGQFQVYTETPTFVVADLAPIVQPGQCRPRLALSDREGIELEIWDTACDDPLMVAPDQLVTGFAGSPGRGMAIEAADVNGDGYLDLVTRQKGGVAGAGNLVDIVLGSATGFARVDPSPLFSDPFADATFSDSLRPRNLAVANLYGNSLPEIVAGFGPSPSEDAGTATLDIAIWENDCAADLNDDGTVDLADLTALIGSMSCAPDPLYLRSADFDGDGCVGLGDLSVLLANFGCDRRN